MLDVRGFMGWSNVLLPGSLTVGLLQGAFGATPAITSFNPSSASAGGAAFTLTVNGNNFTKAAASKWNATALITTYKSSSELTAEVPASLIARAGTARVTVTDAAPGGGASNVVVFTVKPAVPTVEISLSPKETHVGHPSTLSWSAKNAESCKGIGAWSGNQLAAGAQTVTQGSAGTYTYTLTCKNPGGTGSASATLTELSVPSSTVTVEGMTGIPADVTPLLSVAGIWQPVPNRYITSLPYHGDISGPYEDNIVLPNGLEGVVATGWAHDPGSTTFIPVNIALLEQRADGTLREATSTYISDAQTTGGTSVVVADFNRDGVPDIYLAPYNETPTEPTHTVVYLSNPGGKYDRVTLDDHVNAQDAGVADIDATPTVFTASYVAAGHADTVSQYNGRGGFTENPDTGTGGNTSVAVADFYGDGTHSAVYGDFKYGPNYPYLSTEIFGIYLYNLSDLVPAGDAVDVGNPYFDTPAYAGYKSFQDPHGKQSSFRIWTDDFNHDGMLDILVEGAIWNSPQGSLKSVLQMFENKKDYKFTDVTDALDPGFDKNCAQLDADPQSRDIDGSGINSYLLAINSYNSQAPCTYLLVNDGSGRLQPALYQTLYAYGRQLVDWLAGGSGNQKLPFPGFSVATDWNPIIRAYRTPNGSLNFVATVGGWGSPNPNGIAPMTFLFVNIPLQLDITRQYARPIAVTNRNGSHLIRTFAGDDTIYAGNNNGYSTVDGGLGTNTVVYSGPSSKYSITRNADGSWKVEDKVGKDGTDTLIRIQKLQFTDKVLTLSAEP